MVQLSLDGMQDVVDKGLDIAQPFLFGLGFVFGVTEGDAAYNTSHGNPGYTTNLVARIKDTLSHLGLAGITVAPGYTSVAAFKFRPLGFVNKGLAAAIAAWAYKEAKLPYAKEIFNGVFPFGIGYSIGGVFDPAPGLTAAGVGGDARGVVGNYSASSSLSSGGGVATGNVPFNRGEAGMAQQGGIVV